MKRVLVLIPHGAEVYETAAFIDVLGWASLEGSEEIKVVTAGLQPEVTCTFGLRLLPDALIGQLQLEDFDALAIPGGFEEYGYYEEAYSETVGDVIRAFDRSSRPIASVCVGALPVAHAGALTGRCATTYHLGDGRRRRQLAEYDVNVLDQPIVHDANIVTSTAPSTAIDVALTLVEILTDRENADNIRTLMGFGGG